MNGPAWHLFATRAELADALAANVAAALRGSLGAKGFAALAVSGGTTPKLFFPALSAQELDWAKVDVTLVDERFVPPGSDRSNERLVRDGLLEGPASRARFTGLYSAAHDVETAAAEAQGKIAALPRPFTAVVLGMGTDGHTASFFPDADNLDMLLDPANKAEVMAVHADSAGEPRLTLTLSRLAEAELAILHIEGSQKRAVLDAAMADGTLPIARTIAAMKNRVQVYWAP